MIISSATVGRTDRLNKALEHRWALSYKDKELLNPRAGPYRFFVVLCEPTGRLMSQSVERVWGWSEDILGQPTNPTP